MVAVTSNVLSIGELSRLSGLSTHTIRFYEAAGRRGAPATAIGAIAATMSFGWSSCSG
jgi:hypothetical protein